jgi:hypothetical protein
MLLSFFPGNAPAYTQSPNLNWGYTNILEGILPPPGIYLSSYVVGYHADTFRDGPPGDHEIYALVYSPQLVWVSGNTLANGFRYGLQAQLPIQSYNLDSEILTAGNGIVGDLIFGPFIGRTEPLGQDLLLHWYVELTTYAPIGQYDKNASLNPSTNFWTVEPYLAATLQMPGGWSLSTRQNFTYNFTNDQFVPAPGAGEMDLQPGSMWHFNFALSKTLGFIDPNLRLAAVGYYGKQLERDDIDGFKPDTKEEIFGIGPGIHWMNKGVIYSLKTYFEDNASYRPEGTRTVFRVITAF